MWVLIAVGGIGVTVAGNLIWRRSSQADRTENVKGRDEHTKLTVGQHNTTITILCVNEYTTTKKGILNGALCSSMH